MHIINEMEIDGRIEKVIEFIPDPSPFARYNLSDTNAIDRNTIESLFKSLDCILETQEKIMQKLDISLPQYPKLTK